jgi:NADPH:quinone reductase-like Zn-dependent oxidoreductase
MAQQYGRIVCARLGGPEVLVEERAELRDAREGEVRLRVLAAGVSWADCMMRRGTYPDQPKTPFTPGYDVVGVVDQNGPGALRFEAGQIVAALTTRGGYAEYVWAPEGDAALVPKGVSPEEAVCLALNYATAWQMLHRTIALRKGDGILVHSAAGGVGTAMLELAGLDGLRVLGTASKGKHELLARLGGEAIDYRSERFEAAVMRLTEGRGVAAAFDPIGGWHWLRSQRCVQPGGAVVAYGSQGAGKLEDAGGAIVSWLWPGKRFIFYSITTVKRRHPEWFLEDLRTLSQMLAEHRIRPVIGARIPWRQAAEANRMLEEGAVTGKIVLTFDRSPDISS